MLVFHTFGLSHFGLNSLCKIYQSGITDNKLLTEARYKHVLL
jgi:hypothetical protein